MGSFILTFKLLDHPWMIRDLWGIISKRKVILRWVNMKDYIM